MTHELITLTGYRTGGVESPTSIRNGFAFDLTRVNLRDRVVVSAGDSNRSPQRPCRSGRVRPVCPSVCVR